MKRESSNQLSKSEDKKARLEAGLDLVGLKDITELQVENILREVSAPPAVSDHLDKWMKEFTKFLNEIEIKKCKKEKVQSDSSLKQRLPDGFKFSGGKVTSFVPGYRLSAHTNFNLVFPNATGSIGLIIKTNQDIQDDEEMSNSLQLIKDKVCAKLSRCPLVDTVFDGTDLLESTPCVWVTPNLPKLKDQLKIKIVFYLERELSTGITNSLQAEVNRLMSNKSYGEAERLLQIWTRQIKLWLPENMFVVLLLHLHLTNQINTAMKAWSIVRRVWTFLSETKLDDKKIILGLSQTVPDSDPTSPILDRDGSRLLFPEMPKLQWLSLSCMSGAALTSNLKDNLLVKHTAGALYDKLFKITGSNLPTCQLISDLNYALGDRTERIAYVDTSMSQGSVLIGICLNSATYYSPATYGPTSDDPKSERFRKFWGERSELRRFHDGSVRETVVWGNKSNVIIGDIVRAVVGRHYHHLNVDEVDYDWEHAFLLGDGGEAARRQVDQLIPILYSLEGLPLTVSGVSCFSEEWRLTRVGAKPSGWKSGKKIVAKEHGICHLTEKTNMAPPLIPAVDIMLQAEHSGKWPKDEEARRRLKIAWLAEVGVALSKKLEGILQRIVGENLVVVTQSREVVVRFHVGQVKKGFTGNLCELTSWLGSLALSNISWSAGVRLAKRWVSSHLLADVVPDIVIELIMASVYLNPGVFGSVPVSGLSAFCRWLELVSSHDWNEAPLVVSPDMIFTEPRSALPPLAVISPKDPEPGYWCWPGPSWTELNRLVNLSAASLLVLQSANVDNDLRKAFTPAFESYEFLIELKHLQIPNRNLSLSRKIKEENEELSEKEKSMSVPVLDYNPAALLVHELNESFSNIAKFYFDKFGGNVVGVKIHKDVHKRVKINQVGGHLSRGRETELNWGAIVEDWQILGEGVIKSVTCQNPSVFC